VQSADGGSTFTVFMMVNRRGHTSTRLLLEGSTGTSLHGIVFLTKTLLMIWIGRGAAIGRSRRVLLGQKATDQRA